MISTNASDYVAGITTYTTPTLSDIKVGTISTTVLYTVGLQAKFVSTNFSVWKSYQVPFLDHLVIQNSGDFLC